MNAAPALRFVAVAGTAAALLSGPARSQGITPEDIAKMRADLGSRPRVSTVTPGCLSVAGTTLDVHGLNLGAAPGRKKAVVTIGGRTLDLVVRSWANGELSLSVPALGTQPEAAPATFEIRGESGERLPDTEKVLHVCRTRFEQTFTFDLGLCDFSGAALPYDVSGGSGGGGTPVAENARPSGKGRYEAAMVLGSGRWVARPRPVAACPEGRWVPESLAVAVDDAHWQQAFLFRYVIPTRRVLVPAATITTFVQIALAGSSVHLNNYGPKHGKSWLRTGDAYVKLGPAAGGGTFPITIDELRLDPPDPLGRILYYVQNVDSSSMRFTHDAGHYHLVIGFADNPEAIKGEHEGAGASPSMALSGAGIAAALRFTASGGTRPDYVVESVVLSARISGGCSVAGLFDVCTLVTNLLKSGLPARGVPGVEQRVRDALQDPATRKAVGDAIWNGLDSPLGRGVIAGRPGGAPVGRLVRITSATADGLEVEFVPGR